ncbi:hypothetical protein AB6A40_011434 [Gnathostoma spinigerum]|uniref:B9 domain-containing protein 2 n=1 Tax=Gnathostoma spinigerum TaxID=75299 RepID=A0ABD6EXP6_9BILA
MAEVYVIGEITSGEGFPDCRLSCRWRLSVGGGWKVIEGERSSQTQTDLPDFSDCAQFSHPIDIHLKTKTIQGWPKLHLQVWHCDEFGRSEVYAYGSVFLPGTVGEHEVISKQIIV